MADELKIENRQELVEWLQDKPRAWAEVIAARAALRVLPVLGFELDAKKKLTANLIGEKTILQLFRALSVSWVISGRENDGKIEDMRANASAAAVTYSTGTQPGAAFFVAAADVAAYVGGAANISDDDQDLSDAADVISFAADAAKKANSDADTSAAAAQTWEQVTYDAALMVAESARTDGTEVAQILAKRPFWADEYGPVGIAPGWVQERWVLMKSRLLGRGDNNWQVWIGWYDARLEGRLFNPALEVARVLLDERVPGIWVQSVTEINGEIAKLIDDFAQAPAAEEWRALTRIGNLTDLENWASQQSTECQLVVATRLALRILPTANAMFALEEVLPDAKNAKRPILSAFQLINQCWGYLVLSDREKIRRTASVSAADLRVSGDRVMGLKAVVSCYRAISVLHGQSDALTECADTALQAGSTIEQELWESINFDIDELAKEVDPAHLATLPLWGRAQFPTLIEESLESLKRELLLEGEDWLVWLNWYESRLFGVGFNSDLETARLFLDERIPGIWEKSIAEINGEIRKLIEEYEPPTSSGSPQNKVELEQVLADVASPDIEIRNEQIDIAPNAAMDQPDVDSSLVELLEMQKSMIQSILQSLPDQAPKTARISLETYEQHLRERGGSLIPGLLQQHRDAVFADFNAEEAAAWVEGLQSYFKSFFENHPALLEKYNGSQEREQVFDSLRIDFDAYYGKYDLEKDVLDAVSNAHEAGRVSDDMMADIRGAAQASEVFTSLPPPVNDDEAESEKRRTIVGHVARQVGRLSRILKKTSEAIRTAAASSVLYTWLVSEQGKAFLAAIHAALDAFLGLFKFGA